MFEILARHLAELSSWQFNTLVSGFSEVRIRVVDAGSIWIVVANFVRLEEIIQVEYKRGKQRMRNTNI